MVYKVSKDYRRLKQLLDEGNVIVCFIDYDWNMGGGAVTDIAIGRRLGNGEYMRYSISCRGMEYFGIYPSWYASFSEEDLCKRFGKMNVQFIDPDYELNKLDLNIK